MINILTIMGFAICLTLFYGGEPAGPRLSAFSASWPTATASQSSKPKPTPFPTPKVDVATYLHKQGGKTVRIAMAKGEDVGVRVNKADSALGASTGKIVITGGGSIRTQIVVSHDLEFHDGNYTCDTKDVWHGCIQLKDNITVEGKNATIFEPTFRDGGHPAISVFQNYAGAQNVGGVSKNITVKGLRIVGQPCFQLYDAFRTTFQDNEMVNCGGGGLPAVLMKGGGENIWRRNPLRHDEAIGGSVSGEILQIGSTGNKFDVPVTSREN